MEIKEFKRGIDSIITSIHELYEDQEALLDFLHKYLKNDFHNQKKFAYYVDTEKAMYEWQYLCDKFNLYMYLKKRNEELLLEQLQRIKKPKHLQ